MSDSKLALTAEGANALREFADKLEKSVEEINAANDALKGVYNSNAEDLGVHADSFGELLTTVENAAKGATDAVLALPPKMREVAQKIDDYVNSKPTV